MIRRLRGLYLVFRDNAMVYKDVTQWLRNRSFLVLFFGLLALAEAVSAIIMSLGEEVPQPGNVAFVVLYVILAFYAFIIAITGYTLAAKEFQNRTFELYELSGMSLERMVGGKLLSMVCQFFFGFCCIVPFMFFAYVLGGVDFYEVIGSVLFAGLSVLPLYLIAILVAFSVRLKHVSTLGRIAAIGLLIFLGYMGILSIFWRGSPARELFRAYSWLLKQLLSGNKDAWLGFGTFLAFYAQVCLLVFYLACNTISRENDSREMHIKTLLFTLMASWFGFVFYVESNSPHPSPDGVQAFVFPSIVGLMACGGMMFHWRTRIPAIIDCRFRGCSGLRRLYYWFFQPGPRGLMRFVVLCDLFLAGGVFLFLSLFASSASATDRYILECKNLVSCAVQIPYFLVFPLGLLLLFIPKLRDQLAVQRTMVVIFWGLGAAIIGFYISMAEMNHRSWRWLAELIGLFVSPISSFFFVDTQSVVGEAAIPVRWALGVLGLYLMHRMLAWMTGVQREQVYSGSTESSYAETGSPA
jgi:hypothetical protein